MRKLWQAALGQGTGSESGCDVNQISAPNILPIQRRTSRSLKGGDLILGTLEQTEKASFACWPYFMAQ